MEKIKLDSREKTDMVDITEKVKDAVKNSGVKSGICLLFVPHTTAAVTITEYADPNVMKDILTSLNSLVPFENDYKHEEGNSAAHIKSSLFNFSLEMIIDEGELVIGGYQGIFFCEFDGPRENRQVFVKIMEG
ncbi:secondary thiamine-phosphate synthase enzyme YjbQ [Proteiniclasticum sp.]|uniref:secondary thiamine-phosphate synthase enzyme YjbQ n=1 Tax=Proteiniclasticum sp. TaxID=2053595 RepID=UPI002898E643|nr:secondary thiamine-phosphate synthase enzyme YjbQ [Proteiniclasticum sp.]